MIRSLPLRITLIKPPPGVPFCLQQGKDDLVPPSSDSGEIASFDFTVNIANDRNDGPPKFRGPFVQGPPVSGITWDLIEEALSKSSAVLEARIVGTAGDGGPACATVQLLEGEWKLQNTARKPA